MLGIHHVHRTLRSAADILSKRGGQRTPRAAMVPASSSAGLARSGPSRNAPITLASGANSGILLIGRRAPIEQATELSAAVNRCRAGDVLARAAITPSDAALQHPGELGRQSERFSGGWEASCLCVCVHAHTQPTKHHVGLSIDKHP